MPKTLFVCSGNVARSQMAEAFYNHFTGTSDAYSAGTNFQTPKLYPRIPLEICQLMAEKGIDVSAQGLKTIDESFVEAADRIFIMCERKHCPSFLAESEKAVYWRVEDPYKMSMQEMRAIRDQIKSKVKSLT